MKLLHRPVVIGCISSVAAFIIDQMTKALIIANSDIIGIGYPVLPGFNLVFWRNDGVTFGLLGGAPWLSLVVLALIICSWVVSQLLCTHSRMEAFAYGLIIGGAFGNVLDRVRHGAVTDFLDLYIGSTHWPAFNLADASLISGVVILLLVSTTTTACTTAD